MRSKITMMNMMNIKKLILGGFVLFCSFFSLQAFALQTKVIHDNGSASILVSTSGLTRIAVWHDRISNVRGISGAYSVQNDNHQGAVFIQPSQAYQHKPFTLFIATEQGNNYVLHATPQPISADASESILLKPVGVVNPLAKQWETASPYTQILTRLMDDMVKMKSPEGYSVTPVKGKTQYLGRIATVTLKTVYSGAHLQGLIYCIHNRLSQPIMITEHEFYQQGDRAIALASFTIAPKGKTQLYKVRSNG